MYKKSSSGWLKHYDFIILDILCLQIAFVVAFVLRIGFVNPYSHQIYRSLTLFLIIADIAIIFFNETFKSVLKRGYYKEFSKTVQQAFLVTALSVLYAFITKTGEDYSRFILIFTGVIYAILSYLIRILWKSYLRKRISSEKNSSLLVVTTNDKVQQVINVLKKEAYDGRRLSGVILVDEDKTGEDICGIPVVASKETALSYICRQWVDEVLVHVSSDFTNIQALVGRIQETGITVHISINGLSYKEGRKQIIDKVGEYAVLTTSINYMTQKQALFKRVLDIIGGFIGCLMTLIIFVFIAPVIYLSSPGPIFFSQQRVGKNGKKFKIYKFRSMYMDAEERKKELLQQNRVADGMMFKLDFDPRIIGNKILEDGTKKTGIGDFIRRTSLDEFPQFFNVLKGDMSLVGTRPPTVDEWEKYELHHRARLATKPGITGMWQVIGRSKITDFEEVVKLDTKYINEWSTGLDLRILFKTVLTVLKKDGSM